MSECAAALSLWCSLHCPHAAHTRLVALFDRSARSEARAWRCYAPSTLDPSHTRYVAGELYCTRHDALQMELERCLALQQGSHMQGLLHPPVLPPLPSTAPSPPPSHTYTHTLPSTGVSTPSPQHPSLHPPLPRATHRQHQPVLLPSPLPLSPAHPWHKAGHTTARLLSIRPLVVEVPSFLTPEECEALIEATSRQRDEGGCEECGTWWLIRANANRADAQLIASVEERLSSLVGMATHEGENVIKITVRNGIFVPLQNISFSQSWS